MDLTERQIEFLRRVRDDIQLRVASRDEDRARQACRKSGLAMVVMNPRRWIITEAGRAALRRFGC